MEVVNYEGYMCVNGIRSPVVALLTEKAALGSACKHLAPQTEFLRHLKEL